MYKLLLITFILSSFIAISQETIHKCGADEYHNAQIKSKKNNYEKLYAPIEDATKAMRQENQPVAVIPVVVHVIYNSETTNISDEQIASQIAVLNKDFRGVNSDTSKVPALFKNLIADVGIEFCLAQQDPQGNPTNGITRTQTSSSFFTVTGDEAKFDATGGKNIWDRDRYLNIWVVPSLRANASSSATTLGYAEYPGGSASIDGVVVIHRAFGTTGSAQAPFNFGRTTTHEVGHWFGLFHTFQGGCSGTSNANCSLLGDRICDTPPASEPTYGCPTTTKNTCTETPIDRIDMTMNYMDYVNDLCMHFFTQGQKTRMLSFLNNSRQSLLTSNACQPPTPLALNITVLELRESNPSCNSNKDFDLKVKNNGTSNIESVEVSFFENNTLIETSAQNISIMNGDTKTLEFKNITLTSRGEINMEAVITKVNNQTDENLNDNRGSTKVNNPFKVNIPFQEGFESESELAKWTILNPDENFTWERIIAKSPNGTNAMYINNFDYEGGNGQKDDLISPSFTVGNQANLSFDYAYKLYTPLTERVLYSDTLVVLYQEGCSNQLVELQRWDALDLTTGTPYFLEDPYFPVLKDWQTKNIDLGALQGKNIQLVFRNISDHENNLFIDNVNVQGVTSLFDFQSENNYVFNKENTIHWKTNFTVEEIEVYDAMGRRCHQASVGSKNAEDLNFLTSGVYLVKMKGGNKLLTKKIVIN